MQNEFPKHHPSLVYYGENTVSAGFPLIAFVGREPQVDETIAEGIGPYDFVAHSGCAFWSAAYRLLAKADGRLGFDTAAFKRECVQRRASPIVFCDALPIGLSDRNNGRTKDRERKAVTVDLARRHIDGIFELDLMSRVRGAVLCGHSPKPFQFASGVFRENFQKRGIPVLETVFLFPSNTPEIDRAVKASNWLGTMKPILSAFRAQAPHSE